MIRFKLILIFCCTIFTACKTKYATKEFKVYHLYYANDYGPKGDFNNIHENLICEGVGKNILYNKKNFFFRFFKDLQYGYQLAIKIDYIKPDIVIHSAALKHVNLAEENPTSAVEINIRGSLNVIKASKFKQRALSVNFGALSEFKLFFKDGIL